MPEPKLTGRRRRWCSDRCRNAAHGMTLAEIARRRAAVAKMNERWRRLLGECD
jgi:hypothetical protein